MVADDQQGQRRPYAPNANVVAAIQRARSRNLPETINYDFLRLAQMPESVMGRVMEALRFLNLVDVDGTPADSLRALAKAPDEEYRMILSSGLRSAYADDFGRIDPSEDSQAVIIDAFRRYQPRSQTARMVMLFLGLCREAGIPVKDVPRERKQKVGSRRQSASRAAGPRSRASRRAVAGRGDREDHPAQPGLLFGVTDEDVASLDDAVFREVWDALGKVARARAKRASEPSVPAAEADRDDSVAE